jgi:ribosomal protein L34E
MILIAKSFAILSAHVPQTKLGFLAWFGKLLRSAQASVLMFRSAVTFNVRSSFLNLKLGNLIARSVKKRSKMKICSDCNRAICHELGNLIARSVKKRSKMKICSDRNRVICHELVI